jgi:hypothetical protein
MLIASSMAHAGVNPRNGDFYISYEDASLSGQGHEIELTRTYNSKSTKIGWFGYGWGSPFETSLTVTQDRTELSQWLASILPAEYSAHSSMFRCWEV